MRKQTYLCVISYDHGSDCGHIHVNATSAREAITVANARVINAKGICIVAYSRQDLRNHSILLKTADRHNRAHK